MIHRSGQIRKHIKGMIHLKRRNWIESPHAADKSDTDNRQSGTKEGSWNPGMFPHRQYSVTVWREAYFKFWDENENCFQIWQKRQKKLGYFEWQRSARSVASLVKVLFGELAIGRLLGLVLNQHQQGWSLSYSALWLTFLHIKLTFVFFLPFFWHLSLKKTLKPDMSAADDVWH